MKESRIDSQPGEASKAISEAQQYRFTARKQAEEIASTFRAKLSQYRANRKVFMAREWAEAMEQFAGRRVLVVGGGDSALESACGMSVQEGSVVTLSYRGENFDKAKERNVQKLEEAEREGRLKVLRASQVRSISKDSVVLEMGGETLTIPNDDVVVRIGGEPPTKFLEKVGVRSVTKELPLVEAKAGVGG